MPGCAEKKLLESLSGRFLIRFFEAVTQLAKQANSACVVTIKFVEYRVELGQAKKFNYILMYVFIPKLSLLFVFIKG